MNLILVENNLTDVSQYLLNTVENIVFTPGQTTYSDLLEEVKSKGNTYTNVGIFSHGNTNSFTFVETILNTENNDFKNFLLDLKNLTNFQNLDLFSCFFGENLGYISELESLVGINVRASTNITGNPPFGDWIMETDNVDLKTLYFEDTISSFSETLFGTALISDAWIDLYYGVRFNNSLFPILNTDSYKNQIISYYVGKHSSANQVTCKTLCIGDNQLISLGNSCRESTGVIEDIPSILNFSQGVWQFSQNISTWMSTYNNNNRIRKILMLPFGSIVMLASVNATDKKYSLAFVPAIASTLDISASDSITSLGTGLYIYSDNFGIDNIIDIVPSKWMDAVYVIKQTSENESDKQIHALGMGSFSVTNTTSSRATSDSVENENFQFNTGTGTKTTKINSKVNLQISNTNNLYYYLTVDDFYDTLTHGYVIDSVRYLGKEYGFGVFTKKDDRVNFKCQLGNILSRDLFDYSGDNIFNKTIDSNTNQLAFTNDYDHTDATTIANTKKFISTMDITGDINVNIIDICYSLNFTNTSLSMFMILKKDEDIINSTTKYRVVSYDNGTISNSVTRKKLGFEQSICYSPNSENVTTRDMKGILNSKQGNERIKKIFTNTYSFAALTEDGKVLTWGDETAGGRPFSGYYSKNVIDFLDLEGLGSFTNYFDNYSSSAGVFNYGSQTLDYVTGLELSPSYPNINSSHQPTHFTNVVTVIPSSIGYCVLRDDGKGVGTFDLAFWGGWTESNNILRGEATFQSAGLSSNYGVWENNFYPNSRVLNNIVKVFIDEHFTDGYVVLFKDGSLYSWGRSTYRIDFQDFNNNILVAGSHNNNNGEVVIDVKLYSGNVMISSQELASPVNGNVAANTKLAFILVANKVSGAKKLYCYNPLQVSATNITNFYDFSSLGEIISLGGFGVNGTSSFPNVSPTIHVLLKDNSGNYVWKQVLFTSFNSSKQVEDVSNPSMKISGNEVTTTTQPVNLSQISASNIQAGADPNYLLYNPSFAAFSPTDPNDNSITSFLQVVEQTTNNNNNNNTTNTSTSSGDPYITTMSGFKYKLPSMTRTYRCVEFIRNSKKIIVNASVSQLTKSEMETLEVLQSGYFETDKLISNGYFYEKFFISHGDKYAIFDRNLNIVDTNVVSSDLNSDMTIEYDNNHKEFICPIQGAAHYTSIFINISGLKIELMKIQHPQIINGINCSYTGSLEDVKGIFNDEINPKNYKLKSLTSVKSVHINDNLKKYKKNMKESWVNHSSKEITEKIA